MKYFLIALLAVASFGLMPQEAEAVHFGRRAVVVNAPGVNVAVANRGLFGRRSNVFVNAPGVNVNVANRGLFGRRTFVNVNRGFNNAVVVRRGFHGNNLVSVNTNPFASQAVLVNPSFAFSQRRQVFLQPAISSFHSFQQPVFVNNACSFGSCNSAFQVRSFGGCR